MDSSTDTKTDVSLEKPSLKSQTQDSSDEKADKNEKTFICMGDTGISFEYDCFKTHFKTLI